MNPAGRDPQPEPTRSARRLGRRATIGATRCLAVGAAVLAMSGAALFDGPTGGAVAHASPDDDSGGSGGSDEPPAEAPAPDTPAPAPDTPVPDTPAPDTTTSDGGLTPEEWVLIILLGIAVVAIIIAVTSAATSRSDRKAAQRRQLGGRLNSIVSGSRWVNDQAVTHILIATTADDLRQSWSTTRSQLIDLEGQVSGVAGTTGDGGLDKSLSALGQSLAALRGSLDSNVQLRLRPDATEQGAAIQSSSQVVAQCRQQLTSALVPVVAAQP